MTDEEIYQQIDEYKEEADALYEKIHEQVEASIVKHAQAKKRRKKLLSGIMPVVAALIVVLAIVLPVVLEPQDDSIRYSDASELSREKLGGNLKEYYATNNLQLLYLDWYDFAEDLSTFRYFEAGKESDTIYLNEEFFDGNMGCFVQISVMKRNIIVESLDKLFDDPRTANVDVNSIQVSYLLQKHSSFAKFEYQGYKYYLEFDDELTLDSLVETIESMFNN